MIGLDGLIANLFHFLLELVKCLTGLQRDSEDKWTTIVRGARSDCNILISGQTGDQDDEGGQESQKGRS